MDQNKLTMFLQEEESKKIFQKVLKKVNQLSGITFNSDFATEIEYNNWCNCGHHGKLIIRLRFRAAKLMLYKRLILLLLFFFIENQGNKECRQYTTHTERRCSLQTKRYAKTREMQFSDTKSRRLLTTMTWSPSFFKPKYG